ncbi:MAG TPA: hypothetical protein VE987_22285, partial [Polyangiaceae bacterium]|nr:hypothetical protein [Polyangiaceae bacterium]
STNSNAVTNDGLWSSGTPASGASASAIFPGGAAAQNWKWALALLYGGLDLSSPGGSTNPDCNSPQRQALVANWGNLFQAGATACATNPSSVCTDATHGGVLWHAFRRDDASGTSDVFSSLIGLQSLMPSPSASSNSGFGASPYCNAMNWDTNTSNNGSDLNICVLGNNDQFTGPGGILDPASLCVFTNFKSSSLKVAEACMGGSCVVGGTSALACPGSSSCNTPSDIGNVLGAACTTNADCHSGVDQNGASVTFTCTAGACALATPTTGIAGVCSANACSATVPCGFGFSCNIPSGQTQGTCTKTCATSTDCGSGFVCNTATGTCAGNHRRTPKGAYGDTPVGNTAIDVLPTSFQDNDPIRRACLGNTTGNQFKSGEEVCNVDGKLGLVLAIPSSDFIPQQLGKVQYPTAACSTFKLAKPPKILNCAPFNAALGTRSGECPNGDFKLTGGACFGPIATGNSQCLNPFANHSPVHSGTVPSSYDGRRHNLHMYDGSVTGLLTYLQDTIQNGKATPPTVDFVGGMGRIHQTQSIWDTTLSAPPNVACQEVDATDQIACLAQADPCSMGYAGDGGKTWANRQQPLTTAASTVVPALCFTFDTANGGPCIPANGPYTGSDPTLAPAVCPNACLTGPGPGFNSPLTSDSLRADGSYPNETTVTALGSQQLEYQIARKLYLNSIVGFANVGTATTGDPGSPGELDFAKFESSQANMTPILNSIGYFPLGNQAAGTTSVTNTNVTAHLSSFNQPFCEDFNQAMVCNDSALPDGQDNACARNPSPIPGEPGGAAVANVTVSSVCGNGLLEPYEECDDGTVGVNPGAGGGNGASTSPCSTICRCAGTKSYEQVGGTGPFACR